MSYRNQVTIAVHEKDFEPIKNLLSPELLELSDIYGTTDVKVFNFNWIKWDSDEYPEIIEIENHISKTDAIFIRVGEDITDCEEFRYGNDMTLRTIIHLRRYVEINAEREGDN